MHVTAKFVKFVVIVGAGGGVGQLAESSRARGASPVIVVVDSLEVENGGTLLSDVVQLVTTPASCTEQTPCDRVQRHGRSRDAPDFEGPGRAGRRGQSERL